MKSWHHQSSCLQIMRWKSPAIQCFEPGMTQINSSMEESCKLSDVFSQVSWAISQQGMQIVGYCYASKPYIIDCCWPGQSHVPWAYFSAMNQIQNQNREWDMACRWISRASWTPAGSLRTCNGVAHDIVSARLLNPHCMVHDKHWSFYFCHRFPGGAGTCERMSDAGWHRNLLQHLPGTQAAGSMGCYSRRHECMPQWPGFSSGICSLDNSLSPGRHEPSYSRALCKLIHCPIRVTNVTFIIEVKLHIYSMRIETWVLQEENDESCNVIWLALLCWQNT